MAKLLIILPAHNEEEYLATCLDSFVSQSRKPDLLLVVDDGSTDNTAAIASGYASKYPWIQFVQKTDSQQAHRPGAKVVRCFNFGLNTATTSSDKPAIFWDYIGKFDADIRLPENYFEEVLKLMEGDPKIGLCSGLLFVQSSTQWVYEPIADKNHVRGPVKLYRQACFEAIGGLAESIGWDTADVLMARYKGYEVRTLHDLEVHHLRPTAAAYSTSNARKQGEALYKLRYGWVLGILAALKMAWKRRSPGSLWGYAQGAYAAWKAGAECLLSPEAGKFSRNWRWKQIRRKLF